MKRNIKILLTCVGGRLIFDIIKALRDADDFNAFIIGVDTDGSAHGRVLCDEFYVVPDSEKYKDKWITKIFTIHKNFGFDVIITLSEGECILVSENKRKFEDKKIRVSVGDFDFLKIITDKYKMMSFLKENKIHSGSFLAINNKNQALNAIKELGYPKKMVVLKPRSGRGSRGILICKEDQFKFKYLLPDRFCGIGNFESIFFELKKKKLSLNNYLALPYYSKIIRDVDCLSKEGKIVDIVVRLRQLKNPLMPSSTGHMIEMNKKIVNYISTICKAFNINGPCDFDVVLDDTDKPILLDAGSRYSGSVGCSYIAGKNMLAQLVRFLLHIPLKKYKLKKDIVLRPFITMAEIPKENKDDLL